MSWNYQIKAIKAVNCLSSIPSFIPKFVTSQTKQQISKYKYCTISQETKAQKQ